VIRSWGIPIEVEALRPGALPASNLRAGDREDELRGLVDEARAGARSRNDDDQYASLGPSGDMFMPPLAARKRVITCACGTQVIKGSPAAADHEQEHGKHGKR
jgi:hypothetical protein